MMWCVACGGGHAAPDAATTGADGRPADAITSADAGIPVVTGILDPSFGSNGVVTLDAYGTGIGVTIRAVRTDPRRRDSRGERGTAGARRVHGERSA